MKALLDLVPTPPGRQIDWPAILAVLPVLRAQIDCPQDPYYHAEGDVWTHTCLACEALTALPAFRALDAESSLTVFLATLLHDIAKPDTTRRGAGGRIEAPFHGPRGAVQARVLLWKLGVPFALRERVAALIRFHQVPFHLFQLADARRRAIEVSQTARCDELGLVAEADARGRSCADGSRLLESVALFREFCAELGCLDAPYTFPNDHARVLYFRSTARDPAAPAFDDTHGHVTLMSGLPGAGKDRWLREQFHGPVVSLDAIRAELGIQPAASQQPVATAARARARELLRAGTAFAFNGTYLSRSLRRHAIDLFSAYNVRLSIVYVEVSEPRLRDQNRRRDRPVPDAVIDRLLRRWDVPDLTEAHDVTYVVAE